MKKIIYDLGACTGENLNYYLSKADQVIALEANPENCKNIQKKFSKEIQEKKLILINCIVGIDPNINVENFYVHKTNYLLGQFPVPNDPDNFKKVQVNYIDILELLKKYGIPYYIKIDLEEYDHIILERILSHKVKVDYISSEIKKIEDFFLFSKFKKDCSFKIIDGHTVHLVYNNFLENSAGPFGNDLKGNWVSYDNFYKLLKFKLGQRGWLDIHISFIDQGENTFFKFKYFFLDRLSNFKLKYKKKLIRWKKNYFK
tara:strand:+ start:1888 stop:2661 length:774 start_codon:yes stop_codon:yes gene_type:complete